MGGMVGSPDQIFSTSPRTFDFPQKGSACLPKTRPKSLKTLQQECVVIMGTAGDIDEDLLLESGDGSPEKAGNDDISHLGKRKNHRVKSAFKRGKMLVPREGPLTYFAFGR